MFGLYPDNRILKCLGIIFLCVALLYLVELHTGFRSKLADGLFFSAHEMKEMINTSQPCSGYGRNVTHAMNETCLKRLPDCLIIGVEKAGTYALLKFLSAHPQIVRNEAYDEMYFFDRNYAKGLEWYKDKMPYSFPGQVVIEKTPSYFIRQEVPARVSQMNPDVHLLLSVRNPVQRSISAYAMEKERHHGFMKQFEKIILHPSGHFEPSSPFIQHSLYDYYLKNWRKYFKHEQIHIIDGDSLSHHPVKELRKVETFLHIDHYFTDVMFVYNVTKGFYCLKQHKQKGVRKVDRIDCLKESKGRKHPNISSVVIKKMKDYFRPHNKQFYNMTGKYFNWDT